MRLYANRREAGRELGAQLGAYRGRSVVYALPRGGVETAVEVARALEAPLGLVIARKIGHPGNPEYAVCAVTETGPLICDELEAASLKASWLKQAEVAERAEAARRRKVYELGRKRISPAGRIAVVVDDGIATGLTMQAAVAALRTRRPDKLIVAVPAAPRDAINDLAEVVDMSVVLEDPDTYLGAVGSYYADFPQLTDDDVIALLDEAETIA